MMCVTVGHIGRDLECPLIVGYAMFASVIKLPGDYVCLIAYSNLIFDETLKYPCE